MSATLSSKRQINYKIMRVIIGIIAILLSPVVWMLSGVGSELTSISISYWTYSHDIFVGALVVVGFFLAAYNGGGDGRDTEYYVSKAACVFAICVALFPTTGFTPEDVPYPWVQALADWIGVAPNHIHGTTAVLLFICLIVLIWFFSVHAMKKGGQLRAWIYRGVIALMVVGAVVLALLGKINDWNDTVFYVEFWELTWFGFVWLVAGTYRDSKERQMSEKG
jgi:hypothetical protein